MKEERECFVLKGNSKELTEGMKVFSKKNAFVRQSFFSYLNKLADICENENFNGELMIINNPKVKAERIYEGYFIIKDGSLIKSGYLKSEPAHEEKEVFDGDINE